jgi:hypothetical protein
MLLFEQPEGMVVHHMGDYPFNISQMCWFACGSYHVPDNARRMFEEKKYPFRAVATSEQGDAGPDFTARRARLETYLTPDYTVGTSTTSFCGGEQTALYFVTYRRKKDVESYRDVGTIFTKTVIDEEVPGKVRTPTASRLVAGAEQKGQRGSSEVAYANSGEEDALHSHSNAIALQSDSTVLYLSHPHLKLGGEKDEGSIFGTSEGKQISGLAEMVIFPSHFGQIDELIVGGEPRDEWSGEVAHGEWIACRIGRLLVAVRPLCYSRTLGPVKLSLKNINRYQVIQADFYRGEKRQFSRKELRNCFGGFVAEHAGVDEFTSLAEFAATFAEGKFTDYFWATRRVRYRRGESKARPRLEMEVSWSPGTQQLRVAAINGKQIDYPVVKIDGIDEENLPLLNEPFKSVPSFFPWKDFVIEWGEWPWAIGDREDC